MDVFGQVNHQIPSPSRASSRRRNHTVKNLGALMKKNKTVRYENQKKTQKIEGGGAKIENLTPRLSPELFNPRS